jgi:hypothetical protein
LRDEAEARASKTENGKWKHFLHFPFSIFRFPFFTDARASASEIRACAV